MIRMNFFPFRIIVIEKSAKLGIWEAGGRRQGAGRLLVFNVDDSTALHGTSSRGRNLLGEKGKTSFLLALTH